MLNIEKIKGFDDDMEIFATIVDLGILQGRC